MPEDGTTNPPHVVSFQTDIKPLFRASDRTAMQRAFDLWSFADVSAHGTQIAAKLQDGTMPCDGPWRADHVALFMAWLAGGSQP